MAEQLYNETHEQVNASMKELKAKAERLQQTETDENTKKSILDLIQRCNGAMYSHKLHIEHDQFVVIEDFAAKKKFVVIDTSYTSNHCRIVACEYDDAIQNREAVLNYDLLISMKVSGGTNNEAHQLIDEVRKNSGDSTLLYGHKEVRTITNWVYCRI